MVGPTPKRPVRLTFGKLVDRFLREYVTRSGDISYYEQRARVWKAHFGNTIVTAIDARRVEVFRRARERQVGPTTVRQDLVSLSTLFRWAKARGIVRENPANADLVKRPRKSPPNPRPLSDGEVVALLDACPGWLEPIVELALETGVDRSELVGLNWNRHVDRQRKLIRLPRAKTGVGRTIPYGSNRTIKRILSRCAAVEHVSGAVFLNEGRPVTHEGVKTAMRRAWSKALGDHPKPWKSLRATFATRMFTEKGQPVPVVAALMGLTSAHVLEHYFKASGVYLEEAMASAPSGAMEKSK